MKEVVAILVFVIFLFMTVERRVINIHLVPLVHDSIDKHIILPEHYNSKIHEEIGGIHDFLEKLLVSLYTKPNRTLALGSTHYFSSWYNSLKNRSRNMIIDLLDTGQLEFVNGWWLDINGPLVDYRTFIDLQSKGLNFIKTKFGAKHRPSIAYISRYSYVTPGLISLLNAMEYTSVLIENANRKQKISDKIINSESCLTSESFSSYKQSSKLFVTSLPPKAELDLLVFNHICGGVELIDAPGFQNYHESINQLSSYIDSLAKEYRSNNIILPIKIKLGEQISTCLENIDIIIRHMNTMKYRAFYSTPRNYFNEVLKATSLPSERSDDVASTASEHSYVQSKILTIISDVMKLVRDKSQLWRACDFIVAEEFPTEKSNIVELEYLLSLLYYHKFLNKNHHSHTSDRYTSRLYEASESCYSKFNKYVTEKLDISKPLFFCQMDWMNQCSISTRYEFFVILFNPDAVPQSQTISLYLPGSLYRVYDMNFDLVKSLTSPTLTRNTEDLSELIFNAQTPDLGFSVYKIIRESSTKFNSDQKENIDFPNIDGLYNYENDFYAVSFDLQRGTLQWYEHKHEGNNIRIDLSQEQVTVMNGRFYKNSQPSSSYIFKHLQRHKFRPKQTREMAANCTIFNADNDIVKISCTYNNSCRKDFIFDSTLPYIKFGYFIAHSDRYSISIIEKWVTNISSHDVFYTDTNGRSKIRRSRSIQLETDDIFHYFSTVNTIMINDTKLQMIVITDRVALASSTQPGSVEVILSTFPDQYVNSYKNVNKNMNVSGSLWLIFSLPFKQDNLMSEISYNLLHPPIIAYSASNEITRLNGFKSKNYSLPNPIRLLSYERIESLVTDGFITRFENILSDHDKAYEIPNFDIIKFMSPHIVSCIKEQVLSGDILVDRGGINNINCCDCGDDLKVYIEPMKIRTFIITIKVN